MKLKLNVTFSNNAPRQKNKENYLKVKHQTLFYISKEQITPSGLLKRSDLAELLLKP
jgi:hypothetical protein